MMNNRYLDLNHVDFYSRKNFNKVNSVFQRRIFNVGSSFMIPIFSRDPNLQSALIGQSHSTEERFLGTGRSKFYSCSLRFLK